MEITAKQYVTDNIARRYLKFDGETYKSICESNANGLIVADSLAPTSIILEQPLPLNSVFISQTIAALHRGTALPFDELLKILGIKLPEVKKKLTALKKEQLNLILVGYGGYSINTMEFLYQLCIRCGITDLFKTLTIFEADNLTLTNCYRIYKNLLTPIDELTDAQSKLSIVSDNYDGTLSSIINLVPEYLTPEIYESSLKGKRVVFLGAPDFPTRQLLVNEKFIFGGHAGDEVGLISKPHINADITIESYGTINPAVLLMNLLRATVELPSALLSDFPDNTVLFDYNFKDEVVSGRIKSPYNWIVPVTAPNAVCETECEAEVNNGTEASPTNSESVSSIDSVPEF
jgi:hypothetical protein